MATSTPQLTGLVLLAGVPGLALVAGRPPAALLALTTPSADPTAPLVAAVALAAWACTTWLLLIALLAVGGQLHGPLGRAARHLATWVAPASVHALVRVAVGLTVTGTVLSGQALAAEPAPTPPATSVTSTTSAASAVSAPVPSLDWPTTPSGPKAVPTPTATPTPPATNGPVTKTGRTATSGSARSPASTASPRPTAPGATSPTWDEVSAAGTAAGERPALSRDAVPASAVVIVQAGDSLWAIAARDLGASATPARIAQAWPQWWQANRAVLGGDPDLIHPGASLTAP